MAGAVTEERKPSEIPYLHVRPPKRVVGVGGEGEPLAKLYGNRTGLLALRDQVDAALEAEEGEAPMARYRETDEAEYDLVVYRASNRKQMGEPRKPDRPDNSMFA